MEAVVLAGGQGTRLLPHTSDLPKALVPVAGQPVVKILLGRLKSSGINKIRMAVNHRAEQIISALGDGSEMGLNIEYSVENKPLSTVGPLKLLSDLPEQFIVVNADIITDLDFQKLYDFHLENDANLTVATYRRTEVVDYGVLECDVDGRVSTFQEKPSYHFSVSMGIYVFSRSLLAQIPEGEKYGFDNLMKDLLSRGENVATYSYDGYWMDVGRPSDYEQAQKDLEEKPGLCD